VTKAKGLTVTDDELKKAFEENKDKLGSPEAVHLRHILVATEPEANEIVSKIKGGADFKALARDKSLAASGKAAVDAAYRAGLANGGSDDGPPGQRPQYGRRYYAGYLLDPDRLRVEVVSRR